MFINSYLPTAYRATATPEAATIADDPTATPSRRTLSENPERTALSWLVYSESTRKEGRQRGSFSYRGFHASDLDIPTNNELLAMEMQVEMENLRNNFTVELIEIREQISVMQKRFNFSMWILILGVGAALSWVYRSSK
ncbi:unnamed protein product [Lactuca virosa]|uniref:Uncharacterized protein n=1 Tax=Lactuca virosa TaxID=75947 RepID=A0AAU9NRT4_9ASTR|nr:unnamed protein product [Lactuca virosa]